MYGQYGRTAVRVKSRVFASYVHLRMYIRTCFSGTTCNGLMNSFRGRDKTTCSMYVVLTIYCIHLFATAYSVSLPFCILHTYVRMHIHMFSFSVDVF